MKKITVGVFAVLLLASAVAIAQQYQPLPFPQEANPALSNSYADESSSVNADMPSSMAENQSGMFERRHDQADLGSPFPSAANPSLGRGSEDQTTPSWEREHDLGSPFPSAADPSNQ
jgi:hypothetical protein